MKNSNVGLSAIVFVAFAAFLATNATPINNEHLVGANRCTWGPSYWCSNLTNAKGCGAVRHCIQTVWEKQEVTVDNDSICKICKDMVAQARDQLRSNETQEELRQVLEGSCNLIPVKIVKKECSKLADDFIPELIEALSSQMNPDQVCSVAGLCNNAAIDDLLMSFYSSAWDDTLKEEDVHVAEKQTDIKEQLTTKLTTTGSSTNAPKKRLLTCGNCQGLGDYMQKKFTAANRDDVLENLLHVCGQMSSFSDACANIMLVYFNDIYDNLKQSIGAQSVCHMSGVCSHKYHEHPEDLALHAELESQAVDFEEKDDIPCALCQQLVQHLRDLLVANTTEAEFKLVLEGICKQTQGFQKECISIVDQYYDVMYKTLINDLDANGACFMIGVCPKTTSNSMFDAEIRPLLPTFAPAELKVSIRKKLLGANEPKFTQDELMGMTLPIDHLMGAANPLLLVDNGEKCTLCEYILHFVQEALATPANEDKIKDAVNSVCGKMPASVGGHCHDFIEMYGDAVIALLIQGLNPAEVCPKMRMCPLHMDNRKDMEVFNPIAVDESDKPTCPLCLFAVAQAQEKIRDDKSKAHIESVLNNLCTHLPEKLKPECIDFIHTYSSELIDMLITDFKAEEICVALKLCPKTNTFLEDMEITLTDVESSEQDFSLNEIDNSDEKPVEIVFEQDEALAPNCWLCEEIVKNAEKRINKHTTKDDIVQALQRSCTKLRKNVQPACHKYVDKYGDKIAALILKETEPKMICRELGLCLSSELEDLEIDEALKYDVIAMPNMHLSVAKSERLTGLDDIMANSEPPTCVLCEFVMARLEVELRNKTKQDDIKHTIEHICHRMPKTVSKSCDKFMEAYANAIITLIGSVPPKEICTKLMLCAAGGLTEITDEIVECGVCHGATMSLLPYFKEHADKNAIGAQDMIATACEMLPGKYYQSCYQMVSIYGQSILHLSQKPELDEAHICAEIGKCFDNEKSGLAFARIAA